MVMKIKFIFVDIFWFVDNFFFVDILVDNFFIGRQMSRQFFFVDKFVDNFFLSTNLSTVFFLSTILSTNSFCRHFEFFCRHLSIKNTTLRLTKITFDVDCDYKKSKITQFFKILKNSLSQKWTVGGI